MGILSKILKGTGFSFSWKRAIGLTGLRTKASHGVKLTKDGEVDKRTKEYKDSQKKKFRWWKIPFYPFYWIYRLIKFVLTFK